MYSPSFSRYLQDFVFSLFFPFVFISYILILILYSLTFSGGHLPYIITIQANWADGKPHKR